MAVALTPSEVMTLGGYCEGARAYYSFCGVYVFMQGNALRFLHMSGSLKSLTSIAIKSSDTEPA
jgi:hypothetical protein